MICSDADGDDLTYDVFLGLEDQLIMVSSGQTIKNYTPNSLAYSTTYFWSIRANDAESSSLSEQWSFTTMDNPVNSAPTIEITSPEDGETYTSRFILLAGESNDSDGQVTLVQFKQNDGNWEDLTSTGNWSVSVTLIDGLNTLSVRALDDGDAWSSVESIEATYFITTNQAPVVTIDTPTAGEHFETNPITISGTAQDSDGVITQTQVKVNENDWLIAGVNENWSRHLNLEDGDNILYAKTKDNGGSWSEVVTVEVTFTEAFNNAPEVELLYPQENNESYVNDPVMFSCSVTDVEDNIIPNSSIEWSSNIDGFFATGTYTVYSELSAGDHTITLTAEDSGGAQTELTVSISVIPNPNLEIHMVSVPAGSFVRDAVVNLSAFLISKYEVNQLLYEDIMSDNPSDSSGDSLPVESLTWNEAIIFCNLLSIEKGFAPCYTVNGDADTENWDDDFIPVCNWNANGFRLPTEAEWEYAARGATAVHNYIYSGGNEIGPLGWYQGNSMGFSQDIGLKLPNELGIYDMTGNVVEFCWDFYAEYPTTEQTNPTGPDIGEYRILRGGSFLDYASECEVDYRRSGAATSYGAEVGFRVVRTQ
ncbi:MAG: hypothetical protein B6226_01190 [Candidatus Cloacimonetes bacterium 4572_65]|nr:MAG: hypothetical protein B6226_01190 [Candidatus Cloacimonetes bacterium 4572_65]